MKSEGWEETGQADALMRLARVVGHNPRYAQWPPEVKARIDKDSVEHRQLTKFIKQHKPTVASGAAVGKQQGKARQRRAGSGACAATIQKRGRRVLK